MVDIHGIPIRSLWTFVRHAPAFILRRFFPKHRLAELIYVDLRPRFEPATLDLADGGRYSFWFNVINLSPFNVELQSAELSFWYCGCQIKTSLVTKRAFSPGVIEPMQISGVVESGIANQIALTRARSNMLMDGYFEGLIEFDCKLHGFQKNIGHLAGVSPIVSNEISRLQKQPA